MMELSKQIQQPADNKSVQDAYNSLFALSRISAQFARVKRELRYPDGQKESDVEHSYHLSLTATELAATYFPELDAGLVSQFSAVHDLPEVYAGDTPSFDLSDAGRARKEAAEKAALEKLLGELPPHTARLLERYEKQEELEARFVRFVDKVLPVLMVIIAGEASTFKEDFNTPSLSSLREARMREVARLQALFPEFPFIQAVYKLATEEVNKQLFPEEKSD